MTGANELRAPDARALFEVSRPCFHYARRGTPDGAMFERSETGRLLMKAMERIAALIASREAAVKPLGDDAGLVADRVGDAIISFQADRIETLTRELDKAREALGNLVGAIDEGQDIDTINSDYFAAARAALSATTDLGRDTENAG